MTRQWGLKMIEGRIVSYPDEVKARAAAVRMRSWPCTRFTEVVSREMSFGEWVVNALGPDTLES